MRAEKWVSHTLGIARSDAHRLILQKRLVVDGKMLNKPAAQIKSGQQVCIDQKAVAYSEHHYFMLNKPDGYVCASKDAQHPVVNVLVAHPIAAKLHTVGRLDIDTTGLVLLTNDGKWSHQITSPKKHCEKEYEMMLAADLDADAISKLQTGVRLHGEDQPAKATSLIVHDPRRVTMTITEGRYHQVKRMLAAVGNKVIALHRSRIGHLALDGALSSGESRALTRAEIEGICV